MYEMERGLIVSSCRSRRDNIMPFQAFYIYGKVTVMTENKQAMGMDVKTLIALMSDAYRQGLRAGQKTPSMKDNMEFENDAVKLFACGLSDSLLCSAPMGAREQ